MSVAEDSSELGTGHRVRARVLLADDHVFLAEACRDLLQPEFDVVSIVDNGRALVNAAAELKPDVVVLDIAMPLLDGLDAGAQVKQQMPSVKLVYLTMNTDPEVAAQAFRCGASAYVIKSAAFEDLVVAIRRALNCESFLSPQITNETVDYLLKNSASTPNVKRVTRRQAEILRLLAEGKSMKEIARVLHLKPGTIAFHKYRAMAALGLQNNAELLQYAIRHYLTS